MATPSRAPLQRTGTGGSLGVITPANGFARTGTFLAPDRAGGAPTVLTRPRQKAVKKADPAANSGASGARARASDGSASLQLLAHEVVYLRQQLQELTDREREVAFAVCTGGSNERMAERLCIALPTLRTHLMRLNQKLGTARKGDIVRMMASRLLDAYRSGALSVSPGGSVDANGTGPDRI